MARSAHADRNGKSFNSTLSETEHEGVWVLLYRCLWERLPVARGQVRKTAGGMPAYFFGCNRSWMNRTISGVT